MEKSSLLTQIASVLRLIREALLTLALLAIAAGIVYLLLEGSPEQALKQVEALLSRLVEAQ
jgi:hypothetical protein